MIIFDLDGTLADCEHRRYFVDPSKDSNYQYANYSMKNGKPNYQELATWQHKVTGDRFVPDWRSFYESCSEDKPIQPVIDVFRKLALGWQANINIWSGRCESVRQKTEDWLFQSGIGAFDESNLKMRPIGDSTPDDVLKERWLDEYIQTNTQTIAPITEDTPYGLVYIPPNPISFVFDDRPKVVRMWRRRGVFVFDCNQNGDEF